MAVDAPIHSLFFSVSEVSCIARLLHFLNFIVRGFLLSAKCTFSAAETLLIINASL